jgi:predicted TIM-barrel fold metal-dependent hydrolase
MPAFSRRRLLQTALATAALPTRGAAATPTLTDANVSLFHWPFRRLPLDEPAALATRLAALGVGEAWAGSFEGLLHRDLDSVNRRLAAACREVRSLRLRPLGSINPLLPDWPEDLRRCAQVHGMPGIRLHPNHHGYGLEHPEFDRLLRLAGEAGLLVQLVVATEDTRTQPPQTQVADVDLRPLPALLARHGKTRVQLLNHRPGSVTAELAQRPNLWFDIGHTEGTDGVTRLVRLAGAERVLFGSHAPFLIPEAALIRVEEGLLTGLTPAEAEALLFTNARRLLPT